MAVFKRGKLYYFDFEKDGKRYKRSTKTANKRAAMEIEAAFRTALAKGQMGIVERRRVPTLKDFSSRFLSAIKVRSTGKPATLSFYSSKLSRLMDFEPMLNARLDHIDEALIERYVQWRSLCRPELGTGSEVGRRRKKMLAPATINRELATLRRLLRLAFEWEVIERVPKIRMLPGERNREFVLSHELEELYLAKAPQPLRDVATLLLQTGLRVGEALGLEWRDVQLQPAHGAKFGYLKVREGKSKNARRNVSLNAAASELLLKRRECATFEKVFTNESGDGPLSVFTLDDQHARLRASLGWTKDFVIHSLRHTLLTRMGEAGTDVFTIMRVAGHSSVTVSQRYVHPSPQALEMAFEKLDILNAKAAKALQVSPVRQLVPPLSHTSVSHEEVAAI
jgi:integrase